MTRLLEEHGVQTIICNEDLWYFRLLARLGRYRSDLAHNSITGRVIAVPRKELGYWQARLAELKAGTLPDGPDQALFIHEAVHSRQMSGWPFWLWALRYAVSRRFRRRIEEEAYTVHLIYLAQCGIPLEAPYWVDHLQQLYSGAFGARKARETFDRIAAAVCKKVPAARIVETLADPAGAPAYTPWLSCLKR